MRVFVVKNIPYSDMAMLYCGYALLQYSAWQQQQQQRRRPPGARGGAGRR
jgi:hypothetical protein